MRRDLKPSNVLLAEDGPRVIDFGISRAAQESPLTGTGLLIGSPGFMSPEQAQGHPVGPATDIFSLGAVLTFAATGQGPFGAGSSATLLYRVVSTTPALEDVPGTLRPLIERCLAKDPRQRPSTAWLLSELNAHPVPGWLPAPITQAIPSHAPPAPDPAREPADHRDDLPRWPAAEPGSPMPPGGPAGGPSTITSASARIPDGPAPVRQPAGDARRARRRRQPAMWALIITALVVAAGAIAFATVAVANSHHHQGSAEGTPAVSATLPKQATTAVATASTPPSAQASNVSGIQPTVPAGMFWTAAVLSARYLQDAQQMVQRLRQSGFDGEYWRSTAANSTLPGYWVVTSGHFPDRAAAAARAQQLQAAGFNSAYARCVGPPQACASQG